MNWRDIPHPNYGNYGGGNNTGAPPVKPVDLMDSYFMEHDFLLKKAATSEEKREADKALLKNLKKVTYMDLKYPTYGTLYKLGCQLVFNISFWF